MSSSSLRVGKGCYVCGKDHSARTKLSKEETRTAIETLRPKHSFALLTVAYRSLIVDEITGRKEEPNDEVHVVLPDDEEILAYIKSAFFDIFKMLLSELSNAVFCTWLDLHIILQS